MSGILPIIPARSGSKGIRNKNLQKVGGTSLLCRTLTHALELANGTKPVVSSDSLEFANHVGSFLGEDYKKCASNYFEFPSVYFHLRGHEEASDNSLIGPTLARLSLELEDLGVDHEACLLLQPTSPFRTSEELTQQLPILFEKTVEAELSTVSLTRVFDHHPARMYSRTKSGFYESLPSFSQFATSRRQDLEPVFLRDGGYYLAAKKIVRTGQHFGERIIGFERTYPYSINIDNILDLRVANLAYEAGEVRNDPNETHR